MKKSLLALAVAAAGVALVAPKFIGDNADARLNQVIAELNEVPGYDLSIVNTEKSWFGSSSTLKFAFQPLEFDASLAQNPEALAMLESMQFELNLDMQHGPVLLSKGLGLSDIQVRIPNTSDDIKLDGEKVENIYKFDGKLNLFGDLSYADTISAMNFPIGDQGSLDFSGFFGSATTQSGVVDYKAEAGTLDIKTPFFNAVMSDISTDWQGDFDMAKLVKGIYGNMESTFNVGKFEASQGEQPLFGWTDFEIFVNNSADENDVADMQAGYRIAVLDTPIDKFEELDITFEMLNISPLLMEKYNETLLSVQDPQKDNDKLLAELTPAAMEILSEKPEIKITNIGFKTAAGIMKSHADIKLASYEFDESKLKDEAFWQSNLLLDSSVSLPTAMALDLAQKGLMFQFQADPGTAHYTPEQLQEAAAQQAEMMLNNFIQGGFLAEENGELTLTFNVKDAMANLNGQEIPLAALLPAEAE